MRLIDADALFPDANDQMGKPVLAHDKWGTSLSQLRAYISKQLTVDPVKHGHWTNAGVNNECFWLMQCSVCRGLASQVAEHFVYEFCPHCGAKMDEEVR